MATPLSTEVERKLVADLYRLSAERQAAEQRVAADFAARNEAAEKQFATSKKEIGERFQKQTKATEKEFADSLAREVATMDRSRRPPSPRSKRPATACSTTSPRAEQQANKQLETDSWEATTVFEAAHPGLLEQFDIVELRIKGHAQSLADVVGQAHQQLDYCRVPHAWTDTPLEDHADPQGDPFALLPECVAKTQGDLAALRQLLAPRFFVGVRPQIVSAITFVAVMALSGVIVFSVFPPSASARVFIWLGIGALAGAASIVVLLWGLYRRAVFSSHKLCQSIRQSLADGERYRERCNADAKAFYDSQRAKLAKRHRRDLRRATERHLERITEITGDRDAALIEADEVHQRRVADLVERRDAG